MIKKVLFTNLLLLIFLFFSMDYYVFYNQKQKCKFALNYMDNITKKIALSDEYDKKRFLETTTFRNPIYKQKKGGGKSVVFTGCSFVYGTGLREDETISAKIAKYINNPIYNLGLESTSLNHTLFMLESGIFKDKVLEPPAVVIFNYADFLAQRIVMQNVFFEANKYLYKIKDNNLIRKRPPFIITRSPLLCLLRENLYVMLINNNTFYRNYIKNMLEMHFAKIKNLLESEYGDVKFMILVYYPSPLLEEISDKLLEKGFIIVRMKEDFDFDCSNRKYLQPDGHPTSEVWLKTAPKIAERINEVLQ